MTPVRSTNSLSGRMLRGVTAWAWLLAAVAGFAPMAARAMDAREADPDRDVPAALARVAMLSNADAAAQKGTGLIIPVPSIGLLQGPPVRLWDELKVLPQTAPSGSVTITIGRPGN